MSWLIKPPPKRREGANHARRMRVRHQLLAERIGTLQRAPHLRPPEEQALIATLLRKLVA